MTEQTRDAPHDRRKGDRRTGGRRRTDRMAGWRANGPWGAVALLGFVVVVLLIRGAAGEGADSEPRMVAAGEAALSGGGMDGAPSEPRVVTREAFTVAAFEGLLAEGDAAVGQMIRTELYCGSIRQTTIRTSVDMHTSVANLSDSSGRVAAAECRWSQESLSPEFLLVIPASLAEDFARAPEVELNFVTRRHVRGEIEWLGRSEELALRNAGILRRIAD